jgi:hypothetical protein
MKRIISYVLIFSVFVLLLTNCEKDESINIDLLQKRKYKTVSIDEAKNFLESHRTSSFTKSNDLDLNYDIELAAHEDITNSNELLTVIPATTKYTNHYSRVLLLKVNEEIQSVVFSMYASDSSTFSNYSGELLITDLDGNFINGWRIENNEYVTQFVKKEETQNKSFTKNNEGETCPIHGECETVTVDCVICGFSLDEVTVVASSPKPFPYVPTEGIYEEGGSSGGGGNTSSGGDSSDSNGNETENSWAANNCGEGNIADENGNCIVQIINNLTGKAKCVFEKLQAQNGNLFLSTIGEFIDNPDFHLQLNSGGECNTGEDACTDGKNIASGLVIINIISEGRGTLDLATIILHEGIHAEIYKYVYEYNQGVDPQNRENLLGYYFQYQNINIGTAQHQHMADNFVRPIAEAIRTLDNNRYPLEDYMAFGWEGLRKYGWDGYYDNGEWVTLDRSQYAAILDKVLNNTNFNNDCN